MGLVGAACRGVLLVVSDTKIYVITNAARPCLIEFNEYKNEPANQRNPNNNAADFVKFFWIKQLV